MRSCASVLTALGIVALTTAVSVRAAATTPKEGYSEALARETALRRELDGPSGPSAALLKRVRAMVEEYESFARRYPRSGYSDNALYQAAVLSADAYWRFGEPGDRKAALRLFQAVRDQFPTSSLVRQMTPHVTRLDGIAHASSAPSAQRLPGVATPEGAAGRTDERPALKAIRRDVLPDALRVTLEIEREATFHDERIDGPPRVFIDLQNTRAVEGLKDSVLTFPDDVVRQVRVGRQPGATRVVMDLQGAARHSVYALYDPYRIIVDFERAPPMQPSGPAPVEASGPASLAAEALSAKAAAGSGIASSSAKPAAETPGATWTLDTAPPRPVPGTESKATPSAPAAPASNSRGGFSIARQLGLGISRVVIDAGHGGHDPGARVKGLNEADLVLDIALRLEALLLKQPGVEALLTRRTNVYIPLEERTAIANRTGADLFLSIHANASRNARARGIETYFLNFAPNPEAEAIAARENAGSSKTMHNLPDIVKAIALNNKIDESRDFAALVQTSMVDRLRKANRDIRNLGVKQAPFMVLIGATMPSVLAEISFVTNRQEASLLRMQNYRQAIAEALFAGISKYQKSLKSAATVAAQ